MTTEISVVNTEVQRSLGRIEGKLDSLSYSVARHFEDDQRNFAHIDKRLAAVDKLVYKAAGVIGFLAIIIPVAIAYFR